MVIDDDIAVRTALVLLLQGEGYETTEVANPADALHYIQRLPLTLVILDLNFSIETSGWEGMRLLAEIKSIKASLPVILLTGWGTISLAVEGMKLGASDFISKPWDNGYLLQTVKTTLALVDSPVEHHTRKQLDNLYDFKHIVSANDKVVQILDTIGRVASTDAPVLILGESGTGKELIAEAVHDNSKRRSKPFVKVNLGGISSSLFESEMFGHVRGAFTDARTDRAGRFDIANKGTIFLDEIGDLDTSSQVKLLRVLQDRTFEVLGSSRTKTVDVRVVCATNKNLQEMVRNGSFREDLLYRINLVTVQLSPLRERADDIPLLVNSFIASLKEIYNRPLLNVTKQAFKWLQQLPLPGNIRQLKNLVERTVLLSRNDILDVEDFSLQWEQAPGRKGNLQLPEVGTLTLDEMEVLMIKRALEFHKNKIAKAAVSLGLTRSSLYRRLDKYNIPYDEDTD